MSKLSKIFGTARYPLLLPVFMIVSLFWPIFFLNLLVYLLTNTGPCTVLCSSPFNFLYLGVLAGLGISFLFIVFDQKGILRSHYSSEMQYRQLKRFLIIYFAWPYFILYKFWSRIKQKAFQKPVGKLTYLTPAKDFSEDYLQHKNSRPITLNKEKKKVCNNCGNQISLADVFCMSCGQKVP